MPASRMCNGAAFQQRLRLLLFAFRPQRAMLLFAPGGAFALRTIAIGTVALMLACGTVAHSEADVFMRAVGFAFTGGDDWEPKVVDRANCVFEYQDDVFYLNNVQVDRISIQGWENQSIPGLSFISVGL